MYFRVVLFYIYDVLFYIIDVVCKILLTLSNSFPKEFKTFKTSLKINQNE